MSFLEDKIQTEGLTFDDVLLIPAYSEVLPREVSIASRFSRNVQINTPIASAAMDTVTEAEMAIAIARAGGIGVIHKNMTIAEQAAQVRKVKRAENGMIYDPVTIGKDNTVGDALQLMKENRIGGIPVVTPEGVLIGIVTNRDLRFQRDMSRRIEEVMTKENLITTHNPDLQTASDILLQNKIEKLPVVDAGGRLIGLLTYKDITKVQANPNAAKDDKGRLRVAAGVGVTYNTMERVGALAEAQADVIVIDMLRRVKKEYPDLEVVVGNIATGEAAKMLVAAGADGVKVGIGPGSICTTRVIADGGLRYSGDIVKAIAAGADAVMAGSLLAGVEESPGETIIYNGRKFKSYRGMGSLEAMQHGSKDRYFQDMEDDVKKLVPEGIAARVPYKGTLAEVVYQMVGGLRAGMGYCGAKDIEALKKARFIRITNSGMLESHPHDVSITREAPNYSRGE